MLVQHRQLATPNVGMQRQLVTLVHLLRKLEIRFTGVKYGIL